MKKLKAGIYALIFAIAMCLTFQCASPKVATTFENEIPFNIEDVYFQEWYAGIKVGGTGVNIFIPVVDKPADVIVDSVYFRNLQGKLVKTQGKYSAVLKNNSRSYTFRVEDKPEGYPFDLKAYECVISYIQNGETKYYKIQQLNEFAGTYYENGPPSIYVRESSEGLATIDEENDN
ncbi:hypothetical protein [Winogradskyella ouciana]|uniref:Lipoprotein n=1 Tax=Winogradskyella ouciana TaxID=2608631 RepID=A0A7K1GD51_9FLAO|nr:hypothetical protein [Winogradskyella ouciana]MTE27240.1 hypothetical protein [Winogradskyella ouciana]